MNNSLSKSGAAQRNLLSGGGTPSAPNLWFAPIAGTPAANWNNCTIIIRMPGTHLLAPATSWKIRLMISGGTGAHFKAFNILKVLSSTLSPSGAGSAVISSTHVTIGGNMPATVLGSAPFDVVTDAINLTLDQLYDYYIVIYFDTDGTYNTGLTFERNANATDTIWASLGSPMSGGYVTGDHSGDGTIPVLTVGNYAFNSGLVYGIKRVESA